MLNCKSALISFSLFFLSGGVLLRLADSLGASAALLCLFGLLIGSAAALMNDSRTASFGSLAGILCSFLVFQDTLPGILPAEFSLLRAGLVMAVLFALAAYSSRDQASSYCLRWFITLLMTCWILMDSSAFLLVSLGALALFVFLQGQCTMRFRQKARMEAKKAQM